MKALSCLVVKPAPVNFYASKCCSVAASASVVVVSSSLSAASMALSQSTKRTRRRLSECANTPSSIVPSAPEPSSNTGENSATFLTPKKVLVPIGYGTEEMEVVILVDVLRRAGAEVTMASVEPKLEIEASSGTRLVADTFISTCSNQVFDLIALPGGMPGAARLRDSEILKKMTSKQAEEKRLYGAICAAPAVTLLPWGLLRRKQTTGHPAFMDKLPTFWAVKSSIQVSGELTTSRGPGTSFGFAVCLVERLFGESVAKEIGESLLMNSADFESRLKEFNKVEWSLEHTPRVLVPVANGSEEIEVVTIIDILRRAKVDVVVASVEKSVKISASQGIQVVADNFISDAAESKYDAILLPGGIAGTKHLQKSRILKKLLRDQNVAGRIYGAVNSSVTILHQHGLLTEKRVAAHLSSTSELASVVDGAKVVINGKLITGRGLAATIDFALVTVSKFFGHARARSVAEGLVFEYPRS